MRFPSISALQGTLLALSAISTVASSAAILPRASPTCSTTNDLVFKNGDFECGSLFPWRAVWPPFSFSPPRDTSGFLRPLVGPSANQPHPFTQLSTNGTSYWLSKDHPNTGKAAFEVYQAKPPDTAVQLGQAALRQWFYITQGTAYKLTFYTYQTETATNFIGVKINGLGLGTIDPVDNNGVGRWVLNEFDFTAATGGTELEFEFFTGTGSVQRLDGVVLTPGT
ncbi:hypothetical protein MMC10_011355 [Thelotrema lepadinum]|nr:hypothetical protein [Thelotrema lepadinum]